MMSSCAPFDKQFCIMCSVAICIHTVALLSCATGVVVNGVIVSAL